MMEIQFFSEARRYLEHLGYPYESIIIEPRNGKEKYPDISVEINSETFLVLELKSEVIFNTQSNDDVRYHPTVRKLQKEAHELDAKYFIIFNGRTFTWFKTGINGRPEIINEVYFDSHNIHTLDQYKSFNNVLNYCLKNLNKHYSLNESIHFLSIIIYKKINDELFNNEIDYNADYSFINEAKQNRYSENLKHLTINECLRITSETNFLKNRENLVNFISDLYNYSSQALYIPQWLAQLMVQSSGIGQKDITYDIFSRRGAVTTALYLQGNKSVTTIFNESSDSYWIKIIHLLFNGNDQNAIFNDNIIHNIEFPLSIHEASLIFICPPFGFKTDYVNSVSYDIKDVASLSILQAINTVKVNARVIAIVPDSLLGSSNHQKFRSTLLNKAHLEAVISLPNNTFLPHASIKSSIIILKKSNERKYKGTLFSLIESEKKNNIPKNLKLLSESISTYINIDTISEFNYGIVSHNLDHNNLQASKYWIEASQNNPSTLEGGFLSIPLKDLAIAIRKGGAITIDDEYGETPFLGPASVRSMALIKDALSYTSKSKIPKNAPIIDAGDIVINTISNHRGEASIVQHDFHGLHINKHLISVKPNPKLISPEYLAISLNSEFVRNQFYNRTTGAVIPALTLKAVEQVLVPVPSLEQQLATIEEYEKLMISITKAENELIALRSSLKQITNQLGKGQKQ